MLLSRRSISLSAAITLWLAGGRCASAQMPPNVLLPENAVKHVSEHVSAIVAWPNIEIVLGSRATLVVDTGVGPRNGEIIMHEVDKLAKGPVLYLTTTHYHAEHSSGEQGFPVRAILVRPTAQQEELEKRGMPFVEGFRKRTEQMNDLLKDVKFRQPDIAFEREMKLDLGGVTALLFFLGMAHTAGDEMIFVEPDGALLPGDIVQNKTVPFMNMGETNIKNWIEILDKLEALKPRYIVPDHGPLGDGSLILEYRAFFVDLQKRALELKGMGVSVDDAVKMVTDEFKAKHADWGNPNAIGGGVRVLYTKSQ
jgi:glyoxylase-like metal-dependent hydrolase (beta-lactamase superfamily II)